MKVDFSNGGFKKGIYDLDNIELRYNHQILPLDDETGTVALLSFFMQVPDS